MKSILTYEKGIYKYKDHLNKQSNWRLFYKNNLTIASRLNFIFLLLYILTCAVLKKIVEKIYGKWIYLNIFKSFYIEENK